ncbi:unnamed protein product [Moneuplotes crassus]|uniref:Uncharacterized protein n=1 Tax=Euplotes crassus TaxID=5936 RepID=A0AAD2DAY9_EUPCR|nr:unnamed protein product [Moneuplotes crassus]
MDRHIKRIQARPSTQICKRLKPVESQKVYENPNNQKLFTLRGDSSTKSKRKSPSIDKENIQISNIVLNDDSMRNLKAYGYPEGDNQKPDNSSNSQFTAFNQKKHKFKGDANVEDSFGSTKKNIFEQLIANLGIDGSQKHDNKFMETNKELLDNMKKVNNLTTIIQSTMDKFKEYYKLDKLETHFCKLKILLLQSFKIAFNQIADLSAEKDCDNPKEHAKSLRELRQKHKKLKVNYRKKCDDLQDLSHTHQKQMAKLLKKLDFKEREIDKMAQQLEEINEAPDEKSFHGENFDSLYKRIEDLEKENTNLQNYSSSLEEELKQTKLDLHNNQVNLIDPLKNNLAGLEKLIQEKDQKSRSYRRKLRKCKKQLEFTKREKSLGYGQNTYYRDMLVTKKKTRNLKHCSKSRKSSFINENKKNDMNITTLESSRDIEEKHYNSKTPNNFSKQYCELTEENSRLYLDKEQSKSQLDFLRNPPQIENYRKTIETENDIQQVLTPTKINSDESSEEIYYPQRGKSVNSRHLPHRKPKYNYCAIKKGFRKLRDSRNPSESSEDPHNSSDFSKIIDLDSQCYNTYDKHHKVISQTSNPINMRSNPVSQSTKARPLNANKNNKGSVDSEFLCTGKDLQNQNPPRFTKKGRALCEIMMT